jgi:hypothetical protein
VKTELTILKKMTISKEDIEKHVFVVDCFGDSDFHTFYVFAATEDELLVKVSKTEWFRKRFMNSSKYLKLLEKRAALLTEASLSDWLTLATEQCLSLEMHRKYETYAECYYRRIHLE